MKIKRFRVTNYRNIRDSAWINLNDVTAFVGQNEAGKSNLFEALYYLNPFVREASYDPDEDWPIDDWGNREGADGKLVCEAEFILDTNDIESLTEYILLNTDTDTEHSNGDTLEEENDTQSKPRLFWEDSLLIKVIGRYGHFTEFTIKSTGINDSNRILVDEWMKSHVPKFVYIHEYEMSGAQIELNELQARWDKVGRNNQYKLSNDDQTILVILDLAKIDLDDFLEKGDTSEGRTIRSFDKRSASSYLTSQFQKLWSQKKVKFDIEIDGPTLNIFAADEEIGMPVRLKRRSTGFRWYVSFAWRFTHASSGEFKNCILLLEEPGIHLHYSGQRDLLEMFDKLSDKNTILYTTHLASMVDLANPERVRIVESRNHHLAINEGVVSAQKAPMAVIETSLGLTPDLSGMLGNRKVLIVEGGTDALILHKLSGLFKSSGKEGLSDHVYLWPAQTASKTPMYAAFAVGQKWDAAVLLDNDDAGKKAILKINEMLLKSVANECSTQFRILTLKEASALNKTNAAIEDIFPDEFYLDCVNEALGLAIKLEDLPIDGSDMITSRVENILKSRYNRELDKKLILGAMLKKFDSWNTVKDLPGDTEKNARNLICAINKALNIQNVTIKK